MDTLGCDWTLNACDFRTGEIKTDPTNVSCIPAGYLSVVLWFLWEFLFEEKSPYYNGFQDECYIKIASLIHHPCHICWPTNLALSVPWGLCNTVTVCQRTWKTEGRTTDHARHNAQLPTQRTAMFRYPSICVWLDYTVTHGQHQRWGFLSQFPQFRYFPKFSASPKCMLAIVYHVHICQVLPQLSCGDTCQIWMWCK